MRTYSIAWRRQWQPTPVLLPGKSHGWRSPVGCSPWGREESDTTERLHFHFSLSCFGEGNGNPLQPSCLENPRDGGACWAAVYGVTQSRTQLRLLSITLQHREVYSVFCGDLKRQEIHKSGHTCICIADSYCYRAKTTQECKETIFQQIFTKFYICTHAFPLTHKHINILESSLCFAHT